MAEELRHRLQGRRPHRRWGEGMDPLRDFLESVRRHHVAQGNLRGLLHILIGRRSRRKMGRPCRRATWRELAAVLKKVRWDRQAAAELGIDLATLPPRDRGDSGTLSSAVPPSIHPKRAGGRRLIASKKLGYEIGPAPGALRGGHRPAFRNRPISWARPIITNCAHSRCCQRRQLPVSQVPSAAGTE